MLDLFLRSRLIKEICHSMEDCPCSWGFDYCGPLEGIARDGVSVGRFGGLKFLGVGVFLWPWQRVRLAIAVRRCLCRKSIIALSKEVCQCPQK